MRCLACPPRRNGTRKSTLACTHFAGAGTPNNASISGNSTFRAPQSRSTWKKTCGLRVVRAFSVSFQTRSGVRCSSSPGYAAPDVTLEQDLLRRDLTINALAQDENGQIVDAYGGQDDLRNRLLRHISSSPALVMAVISAIVSSAIRKLRWA